MRSSNRILIPVLALALIAPFVQAEVLEDVVAKVLAAAGPAGLSPAIAEPVWRTLIDRCIAHEFEAFDRTRA